MTRSKTFASGAALSASDVNTHLVQHVPQAGDPVDTGWNTVVLGAATIRYARTGMECTVHVTVGGTGYTGNILQIEGGASVLPRDMWPLVAAKGAATAEQPGVAIHSATLAVYPGGGVVFFKPADAHASIDGTASYRAAS